MQFDLKLGFGKTTTSKTQLVPALGIFWHKIYKIIFFMLLVGAFVLAWFIWRNSLSGDGWSAEKKQAYLDSQNKGVTFRENDFRKALADIEARKHGDSDSYQPAKDIFKAY